MAVFSFKSVLEKTFVERLLAAYQSAYGSSGSEENEYGDIIRAAGSMAVEILANTDALYHDVEHTVMTTLVGQEILRGKLIIEGSVTPMDWVHFTISLLCHDIGYVRNICPGDDGNLAVINADGDTVTIPPGATDAFLTPHHVERGKMFVKNRFRAHPMIDPEVIAHNIENTRFPVPSDEDSKNYADWPGLVRAADLIGQMADLDYLRKIPALFYEFEETGANEIMGNAHPEDLRQNYPSFFWNMVNDHIGYGIRFLQVTEQGRSWLAGLYAHVFSEEHRKVL